MNETVKNIWVLCNYFRTSIAYILIKKCKMASKAHKDISAYCNYMFGGKNNFHTFSKLLIEERSVRNVLLNRLHRNPLMYVVFRLLFSPLESLYINMPPESIGGGLSFQHGFSTIVAAKSIGENCRINQQCTIGYNGDEAPIIEDNCRICAGAIIVGGCHLYSGCIVGAGAVVVNDVSENAVAVGVPAKKIHNKGTAII